ncbi:DMT family transporter [Mycolicibacterium sp. XJ870]
MSALIVMIVLALAAAFLFALAAHLQRRGAHEVMAGAGAPLQDSSGAKRLLSGLPGNRTWLTGVAANFGAFALQAAALAKGSVATVQPLISTQLLFVVAMGSVRQREWPPLRDCLSALAVCAGLAWLLATEGRIVLHGQPDRGRILLTVVVVVVVIAVLVAAGRASQAWLASMLLGVGTGLFQAMSAGFMKLALRDYAAGGLQATVQDWPLYAVPVSVLGGVVLGQLAFATGSLPPAVAAMSVTNPVASLTFALFAFETFPRDAGLLTAVVLSGALIAAGIIGIATAPGTRQMLNADVTLPERPH